MRTITTSLLAAFLLTAGASAAQSLQVVQEEPRFVDLIVGKQLTRFGISLSVSADGAIKGRAFGRDVTGVWEWRDGYFCRDLYYGDRDLGPNCQQVAANGSTVRFTSDRGTGMSADFQLR